MCLRKVDMTVLEALETRAPDWRLWEWREMNPLVPPLHHTVV